MMKYLLTTIVGLFLWCGCDDSETLVATSLPEFGYQLPQGNHSYDAKIVEWHERCGFYFLYKFEPKDVYFNLDNTWAGLIVDTIYDEDGKVRHVKYEGINVDPADEAYIEEQLAWVEEMLLNHYSDELLKKGLPAKLILGRNLQEGGYYGLNGVEYHNRVFNTLMFGHGDASLKNLSYRDKWYTKNNLNNWLITEKLGNYLPNLKEFYEKIDYQMIVDTRNLTEDVRIAKWRSLGYIIKYPNFSTITGAQSADFEEYFKMITQTSYAKLTAPPIQYDTYAGMLHPDVDVNGKIRERYEIFVRIFKAWGVDLKAIGDLYPQ